MLFLGLCFLGFNAGLSAQKNVDYYVVSNITFTGLKRTKLYVVQRELNFKIGDTISKNDFETTLEWNKNLLFNTRLFNSVKIQPSFQDQNLVSLSIEVDERWYYWPIPGITFADRNPTIWLQTKDPGRLNYALELADYNFLGRKDIVKLGFVLGYTNALNFEYRSGFLNKSGTLGLNLAFETGNNKEIWYATKENKVQFHFNAAEPALRFYSSRAELIYRPNFYFFHKFAAIHETSKVASNILDSNLNPQYHIHQKEIQHGFSIRYTLTNDKRDVAYYPLVGHFMECAVQPVYYFQNSGLVLRSSLVAYKYFKIKKKVYASVGFNGHITHGENLPYTMLRAIGYQNNIRGFEPFVADGFRVAKGSTALKYEIMNQSFRLPFKKKNPFSILPVHVLVGIFGDAGYAQNSSNLDYYYLSNSYSNKLLSGFGLGLDFITFYERVMRIEYSINNFGFSGIYFNFAAPI